MSKLLSGTDFCFSTSSKLTLGRSLWVFSQIRGKQLTPGKMGAHFFLRSLSSWEWRMSETLDVSISIHSAIPSNKGGGGRNFHKISLYERSLSVWITSRARLTSLPIVHYWTIPSFMRHWQSNSLGLFTTAKSARASTLAQTTDYK